MNLIPKRFFGGLESLRGIAALMVVLYHTGVENPLINCVFLRNGYLMVDLFFVLSGFVICHNYGAKIKNFKDATFFIFLRLGRLYPLHLFFLLVFLGVEWAKYVGERKFGLIPYQSQAFTFNNAPSFVANLLLIHPFFKFSNISFNGPSWSIGVEFYTYILFTLVILTAHNRRKRVFLSAILLVLSSAFCIGYFGGGGLNAWAGWNFLRCLLGFFIGLLAYHFYDLYHAPLSHYCAKLEVGLVLLLVIFLSFKENARWDCLVLLIFAPLIVVVAASPEGRGMISKVLNSVPARWLGQVSYSIYMTHVFIGLLMGRILVFAEKSLVSAPRNATLMAWIGLGFVFLTVVLVLLVSHFTHQWIEVTGQKTFRQLGTKWFGQHQGARPN